MALAIVAILSTVAVTQFTNFSKDAQIAVTKERMNTIRVAIKGDARMVQNGQFVRPGFEAHIGKLPGVITSQIDATALNELVENPGDYDDYSVVTKLGWRGPYLSDSDADWHKDAWGNEFSYDPVGKTLTSMGPDGDLATTDDNIVITL